MDATRLVSPECFPGKNPGSFPVAGRCGGEFVFLPVYPVPIARQVSLVIDAVTETLEAGLPA